jgi:hypothetical membrane protein
MADRIGAAPVSTGSRAGEVAGAVCWLVGVLQYFVVQFVVAAAWTTPYSLVDNYISDLGNTRCGMFAVPRGTPAYVCSPEHALMNVSFCLAGLLTLAGVLLLWRAWPRRAMVTTAMVVFLVAGVLRTAVGLAPENENFNLHLLAAFNIPVAAVAILLLSVAVWRTRRVLATTGVVLAILSLVGSVLSVAGQYGGAALYLGLGVGGTERLAGYSGNLWMVIAALVILLAPRPDRP